ncbi:HD domain-containing protein [Litorihabitans aurantiacus]|uniref:Metal-dependent HD superfamily phosphohydrolase n=1 Tax=Litorihabitans aurantiacus TaxID=1930061 RepID=A0AA37XCY2_9MICO|nr:hypothetical protein [Litorihabitans aurantiacus]GMA30358.1 hypothetical protein GCM10025875_03500 [Litorihabitans aurantiacus]
MLEAPQWLVPAFARSARAIGADAPPDRVEAVGRGLIDSWSSPDRYHHAVKHLVDVLASIDQLAEETHDPDVVRIAGWYHGCEFTAQARASYAHKGGEDTMASAERARRELPELGVPAATVERVGAMIAQIHRHSASSVDVDAQALSDADLAGLACEPQKYAAYRRNVRAEFAHIPAEDYLEARIAILQKLTARPQIFCSPMGRAWEEPARENIAAELCRLTAELESVEAAAQGPDAVHEPDDATPGDAVGRESGGSGPEAGHDGAGDDGAQGPRENAATSAARRVDRLSPADGGARRSTSTLGRAPRPDPRS